MCPPPLSDSVLLPCALYETRSESEITENDSPLISKGVCVCVCACHLHARHACWGLFAGKAMRLYDLGVSLLWAMIHDLGASICVEPNYRSCGSFIFSMVSAAYARSNSGHK